MITVTVACCQVELDVHKPRDAWRRVVAMIEDAAVRGADLVVAPELSNSGYCFESPSQARENSTPIPGPCTDDLIRVSAEHDTVIVCGLNEDGGDNLYSSAVIVDHGKLLGCYRKSHLWDSEHQFFAAGDEPPLVVETSLGRVAAAVCYDIEFPETVRLAAESGADILAAPVNWPLLPRPDQMLPIEMVKAMAHAGEYRIPIAIADRSGRERGTDWIGGSVIIDASGYPVDVPHLSTPPRPATVTADLQLGSDRQISQFNNVFSDRRTDIYSTSHMNNR